LLLYHALLLFRFLTSATLKYFGGQRIEK